ncbi:transcription and mRNA export factor ENY2 [Dendrobium catenatum]|uniref:transcription and mRNA export factor ENY2 n=1 Tax=Dendrobium catenatum TaxID=906689 RepID=UPI00109F6428|nr:transcription and mRNA export factor ENY2 [Dendrobium catenatum]
MRGSVNRPPTPDVDDEPQKEPTLQEIINIKLIESGEKEKLMDLLRERLIECGWRDEMKTLCRCCLF